MQVEHKVETQGFDRRWRPALLAFFARRIGDRAEAEDLTQEVFERLWRSDVEVERPEAYVFQIATNLLSDRQRRLRVRDRHRQYVEAEERRDIEFLDPYTVVSDRQRVERLVQCLEALPDRTRTIFILFKFEQLSQDTIAERYGISKSAVKKQIARALALLAAGMGEG
ncbi:sigma-70 family RNA polymerase sigma factor [Novosphingobium sp. 1949]|uniref:Sigma-70 family RNA polymerase sigma factor n=1 Tax=Novosphingobium organovorum TaxID=2930092 RepID=A0ABT0BCH6_9SPHN|nr:sigma-70 family RNA polymerase sigma factor [Novosphingobium organovorum]MCJ2182553.1 sigma-70 family RNA polymerase sigma factor [Novosphingobium organovorum]